jgi:hypothetical protein
MKKSELLQLTQIIEHIVAKEVRKQLPAIIAETFQNMMGKSVVTEQKRLPEPDIEEEIESAKTVEKGSSTKLKASLRELFAGTPVMKIPPEQSQTKQSKKYTKDPVLNQILNETVSDLKQRESMVGMAAFQGGYSLTLNMVPGFDPNAAMMMEEPSEEPSYMKGVPSLTPPSRRIAPMPMARPPVFVEEQESNHAPLSVLPEGVSVLDVVKQVPPSPATQALTQNYSQMMKLIDQKKKK